MSFILCTDAVPKIFGIFDLSVAPPLLYYSYIPIILLSLFFGTFILVKDHYSARGKFLFGLSISFVVWIFNIILQWILVPASPNMFSWQITAVIQIFIPLFVLKFFLAFIDEGGVPRFIQNLSSLLIISIAVLLPTSLNMSSFSLSQCQAAVGPLLYGIEAIEIFFGLLVICISIKQYRSTELTSTQKKENIILAIGSATFLFVFAASNLLGFFTSIYQFNFIGPIGMVVFLALMTYMIVRFKAFNIKLLGAQALVWALVVLIGSEFFFVRTVTNQILIGITLIVSSALGLVLVRSVKKEVESREVIEGLAKKLASSNEELESANEKLKFLDQQKSEFVSIASHQLRSPLTVIKGYLSMFLEGEPGLVDTKLGTITPKGVEVMHTMLQSTNRLVHIIEDFLNVSRIEQGRMKYEMSDFDVRHMASDLVNEFQAEVKGRNLTLEFKDSTPSESYMVNADSGKIRQVIGNVIDNSIKYTPQGGIMVNLARDKDSITIKVKDTGIGISAENLKNLFQKFGRAENAGKVNVTGSGLGLFVAIEMMKAHHGKLWAESGGEGKGSTFIIELPIKQN